MTEAMRAIGLDDHGSQDLGAAAVDLLEQREVAETFHAPCDTPFCEDAHIGMDVTVAFGDMVYSDPALPGVRWLDGRDPVVLGLEHVAT